MTIFCPVTTRKTRTLTKNIGSWNFVCRFPITQLDKIWRKNFHDQQFCFQKFVLLIKNFVNQNFLLTRNCWQPKIFAYQNLAFCLPKPFVLLTKILKIFNKQISLLKKFFWPKIFLTKNFFDQKSFLQKTFLTKNFFVQKYFLTKSFFNQHFF